MTNDALSIEQRNLGMQNLRPSNVKAIFQQPSCDYYHTVGFGFDFRYCPRGWY